MRPTRRVLKSKRKTRRVRAGGIGTFFRRCVGDSCTLSKPAAANATANATANAPVNAANVAPVVNPATAAPTAAPSVPSTMPFIPPIQLPTVTCELKGMHPRNCGPSGCNMSSVTGNHTPALCSLTNNKGCPSFQKGKRMGANSAFGTVYDTCCGESAPCSHVTKIVPFSKNASRRQVAKPDDFMKEMAFQAEAAALGIAPAIRNVYVTASHGVAIMDRLPHDAFSMIIGVAQNSVSEGQEESIGQGLADEIGKTMMKLHAARMLHLDAHGHNIMFDARMKCMLIDFGMARRFKLSALVAQPAEKDEALMEAMLKKDYRMFVEREDNYMYMSRMIDRLADRKVVFKRFDKIISAFEARLREWMDRDIDRTVELVRKARFASSKSVSKASPLN